MKTVIEATLIVGCALAEYGCHHLVAWSMSRGEPPSPPDAPGRSHYWTKLTIDLQAPADRERVEQAFRDGAADLKYNCRKHAVYDLHCIAQDKDDGQFHIATTELALLSSQSCATVTVEAYAKERHPPESAYEKAKTAITARLSAAFRARVEGGVGFDTGQKCGI